MAAKHRQRGFGSNLIGPYFIGTRPGWSSLSHLRAGHRALLSGMARVLDPSSDLHAQLEVLTSEGVATSAIEGERFDPKAVRSCLARRLGLPTAGLPAPPRSVEGLVDVLLDATQRLDKPLTAKVLSGWQAALFPGGRSGLNTIRVGKLRGTAAMRIVSGPTGRQRVHYEAPPRKGLEKELTSLLAWFNQPPGPKSTVSCALGLLTPGSS